MPKKSVKKISQNAPLTRVLKLRFAAACLQILVKLFKNILSFHFSIILAEGKNIFPVLNDQSFLLDPKKPS